MDNAIIECDVDDIVAKVDFTEFINKDILITGASGLIGTYLLFSLKRFIEQGNNIHRLVIVVHNDLPEHLQVFSSYDWVELFKGDLSDSNFCASLPSSDFIIHAAGYAQPGKFTSDPVKTLKINTVATFQLFEKLNLGGKFLFVSTSEVYSGSDKIPYKENDIGTTNTDHDRACYIEGKRCGEAICNAYRLKGVAAKSARLSLAYGPGVRVGDQRALYTFIEKAFSGKITLMDHGEAKRTYCYVSDAVEILWKILLEGKEAVYNVGGKSHTTILELAQMIATRLNVKVEVPDGKASLGGSPTAVYVDMDKAEKEFTKKNYISLEDGLTHTIEWLKINFMNDKTRR